MKNHKKRLRSRYYNVGIEGFHSYELLELMLSYSIVRKDTKSIAKSLITKFSTISNVISAEIEELIEIDGIGKRTALYLKLFKDISSFHIKEEFLNQEFFKNTKQVYEYYKMYFKNKKFEEFHVLYLNTKNMIIKEELLFSGIQNEIRIYVKKLLKNVVLYHANSIIVVHNHPSGNLEPSQNDINITQKIVKALNIIDIKLLDHLIIGDNEYISIISHT